MVSIQRLTYLLGVTLVIGGFGLLGAMAMSRVAFAAVINTMGCPTQYIGDPQPCHLVLDQLNTYTKLTGGGGLIGMLLGSVGIHYAQRGGSDDA